MTLKRKYKSPQLRTEELPKTSAQLACVSPLPNSCTPLNGLDCCYGNDPALCDNEVNCPPF